MHEHGTHSDLMANQAAYFKMVCAQLSPTKDDVDADNRYTLGYVQSYIIWDFLF